MMQTEKVLFLGPENSPLLTWLREQHEDVLQTAEKITPEDIRAWNVGFLVSYGYRHIIRQPVLALLPERAINLHISYLPWNRGADPNLWSFLESTPKGVSIHHLDQGIDTGDIILQKQVAFSAAEPTLATTYARLQAEIQQLFRDHWPKLKAGYLPRKRQAGVGTYHRMQDKEAVAHLLAEGWNTPVSVLDGYAVSHKAAMS
jgi:methionyl-tRNA formyltransferase